MNGQIFEFFFALFERNALCRILPVSYNTIKIQINIFNMIMIYVHPSTNSFCMKFSNYFNARVKVINTVILNLIQLFLSCLKLDTI